jgi:hypothetical protein
MALHKGISLIGSEGHVLLYPQSAKKGSVRDRRAPLRQHYGIRQAQTGETAFR